MSRGGSVSGSWKWRPVIRSPADNPICDPSISGGFSRLVTFDLADSPMLYGRKFLCTTTMEYNLYASNGKAIVSVKFIIKIHTISSIYIYGCWQMQSYLRKFRYLKRRIWEIHPKSTWWWQRHFAWRLAQPTTTTTTNTSAFNDTSIHIGDKN